MNWNKILQNGSLILVGLISITSIIYLTIQNEKLVNDYNELYKQATNLQISLNNTKNFSNSIINKERCELYNAKNQVYDERTQPNGVYWPTTDFYCVWAKNRYLTQIESVDRHEYCHYLVDNDYNHFCLADDYWKNKAKEILNCGTQ
jgi:hypothetical protein